MLCLCFCPFTLFSHLNYFFTIYFYVPNSFFTHISQLPYFLSSSSLLLLYFLFLPPFLPLFIYLLFPPSGAIKSWQQTVSRRCFGHGIEMTWLRKWSSPWPRRAWGPSALHTEISLPLRVSLTGTTKMISSVDWPASVWWALKTPWDPRLVVNAQREVKWDWHHYDVSIITANQYRIFRHVWKRTLLARSTNDAFTLQG